MATRSTTAQHEGRELAKTLVALSCSPQPVPSRSMSPSGGRGSRARAGRLLVGGVAAVALLARWARSSLQAGRSTSSSARPTPSASSRREPETCSAPPQRLRERAQRLLARRADDGRATSRCSAPGRELRGALVPRAARSPSPPATRTTSTSRRSLSSGPVGLALLLATLALPLLALPAVRALRVRARRRRRRTSPTCPRGRRLGLGDPRRHRAGDLLRRCPARPWPARRAAVADRQAARRSPSHCSPRSPRSRSSGTSATAPPRRASTRRAARAGARRFARRSERSRWAPWSEEPWQLRGEAELELGDDDGRPAQPSRARSTAIRRAGVAWLDLAPWRAADVNARMALDRATALNPRRPRGRSTPNKSLTIERAWVQAAEASTEQNE